MRKIIAGVTLVVCLGIIGTCFAAFEPTAQVDASNKSPYTGAKARIAVADFEVKAAKATDQIGQGLREMLITALMDTNRFRVVERQVLSAVMQEQELAASGAAQSGGPKRGNIKTADLVITAAVTEFEPQAKGGKAGIGGGSGIGSGILGAALGGSMNKAHMALDIRIIDAATSEILAAQRVQGTATDVAGGLMAGFAGSWGLGGGLSGYAKTPMEKAIRVCIVEAVNYISQGISPEWFKY